MAEPGALLDRGDFENWRIGGWAVDRYVGAVTREHADIDLAIQDVEEIARLVALRDRKRSKNCVGCNDLRPRRGRTADATLR